MANTVLFLSGILLLSFLAASPASARLGARSCHGSLFFTDFRIPPLGDHDSFPSTVFSITTAKISDGTSISTWIGYRLPASFDKVRLSGFLSRRLGNPNFWDTLDFERLPKGDFVIEEASPTIDVPIDEPGKQFFRTVDVTPRNTERLPWTDSFLPTRIWNHNHPHEVHEYPPQRPGDGWLVLFSAVNDMGTIAIGLLLGAACGAAVAAVFSLAWSFFARETDEEGEDDDTFYGYQQIPSPKASEKLIKDETKNKA